MSSDSQSSIDYLAEAAADEGFDFAAHSSDKATLSLPVVHATGKVVVYSIDLAARGSAVQAAESEAAHLLPRFCPERHIVGNGGFCIYWEAEQQFPVTDRASAKRWISVLVNFLRYQERAAYLRRWPNNEAWAHGDGAARAQRRAERLAVKLGAPWSEWLTDRELKANREICGVYRIERAGAFLFVTWRSPDRGRRRNGKGLAVFERTPDGKKRCTSPVRAFTLNCFAMALSDWQRAEDAFWNFYRDNPCCGTMDTCRLGRAA